MIEFELKRKEVKDIGLDESIKKLKPEQIEKAVNAVLNMRGTAGRFKAPLDTCIHCALCSKACHWYHSFGGDPTYTPVAKVLLFAVGGICDSRRQKTEHHSNKGYDENRYQG